MFVTLTFAAFASLVASPPVPQRVLVESWDSDALSERDVERIDAQIRGAVVQRGSKLATQKAAAAARRCNDKACLNRTLSAHGVRFWLSPTLTGKNRNYELQITLWSVESEAPVTVIREECVVCGQAELGNLAVAAVSRLHSWMSPLGDADMPRITVHTTPADASISIDGDPMPEGFVQGPVQPGKHTVTVTAPGYRTATRGVTVESGETERIDVRLRHDDWITHRGTTWGVVALASGVATLGVGVGLSVLDGRDVRRRCSDNLANIDADGDCRYVHHTAFAGGLLTGLGASLTAVGVTVLAIRHHRKHNKRDVAFDVNPRGVSISGRF